MLSFLGFGAKNSDENPLKITTEELKPPGNVNLNNKHESPLAQFDIVQAAKLRIKINEHKLKNPDDFLYGKLYQLVSDKSKQVTGCDRKYGIEKWLKQSSKEDIISEAIKILTDYETKLIPTGPRIGKKMKRTQEKRLLNDKNEWNDWVYVMKQSFQPKKDDFYVGRCVQFLLDTNGHLYKSSMFKNPNQIVELMKKEKERVLFKQLDGQLIHISYSMCECEEWRIGEKRCECGNRRINLDYEMPDVDDTDLNYEVMAD